MSEFLDRVARFFGSGGGGGTLGGAAQDVNNGTGVPQSAAAQAAIDSTFAPKLFQKVADGPLSALERVESVPKLQYPLDLGSNGGGNSAQSHAVRYRHAMRLLIFKQRTQSSIKGILNQPNSLDRSKVASIANRYDTNISELAVDSLAGAAVVDAAVTAVVGAKGGRAANRVLETFKGAASAAGRAAVTAAGGVSLGGYLRDTSSSAAVTVTTKPLAYINLYMPEGLQFTDRQDYDAISVTDALGTAGLITQGSSQEILGRAGENLTVFGQNVFGKGATELALYNAGYALNPQLEVLFKGTKNREFVFTFKFAPRNQAEAKEVIEIIKTLRYHAAPNFDSRTAQAGSSEAPLQNGSRYIIPPSQIEIEFVIMDARKDGTSVATYNDNLPRIAPCVLTNVDTNYAPSGNYSTFADGKPIEIQMQLTFTETVILTKDDIEAGY